MVFGAARTILLLFRVFDQLQGDRARCLFQVAKQLRRPARNKVHERENRADDVDEAPGVVAVAVVEVVEHPVHGMVVAVDGLEIVVESGNTNRIEPVSVFSRSTREAVWKKKKGCNTDVIAFILRA